MNKELFFRIADAIEAEPHLYNQGTWALYVEDCQTVCCVAGWACLIEDQEIPENNISQRAAKLLKIKAYQANQLFSGVWPLRWFPDEKNRISGKPSPREASIILRKIANGEIEL